MSDKKKPADGGPVLKRDENNLLDKGEAAKVADELIHKLITEERRHEKELSFHTARQGRRDIVVMMGVYIRNSVDGKIVLGEDETRGYERFADRDAYKYKTFDVLTIEYPARNLPGRNEFIGKGLLSGFGVIVKWLAAIGAIRG